MGYPKIRQGDDKLWHAWVTVGTKGNGRPDQRHVKRRTRGEVEDRVEELLTQRKSGAVVKPGRAPTVEAWLTTYFDTIAPRRCDPSTIVGDRSLAKTWVYPRYATTRADRFQSTDLDAIYTAMADAGRADSSILKLHRIMSRALEQARRRGVVTRNVAKDTDPPSVKRGEVVPLDEDAANAVLDAAAGRRNAARWAVALAIGLRVGEALGLRWSYVDLDAGEIRVWWQLHRRAFRHGCGYAPCGRRRGGNCPQRTLPLRRGEVQLRGGLILKPPKGKSKRTIPIPAELVEQLRAHHEVQDLERQFAGGAYTDHDLVFASPLGEPVDPGADDDEWHAVLKAAGVPRARVHDGRHTAATLLIAQGHPIEVAQEILGHSDIRITRGYSHVASKMARAATDSMGQALLKKRRTP
jgi:integrase